MAAAAGLLTWTLAPLFHPRAQKLLRHGSLLSLLLVLSLVGGSVTLWQVSQVRATTPAPVAAPPLTWTAEHVERLEGRLTLQTVD
ncbi:hypothetical protein K7W42_15455 [Deinococcus sp. HMF7604]|uniref:hypothetical protein n=1 Tax=Deinococcus betulae TaxID=2873312 RepID=UPI001CCDC879|nr:hypothetical protein [Deinococcus betulae]MBZ9752249.1 hypothetical protein [Deinococcus betulae]